MTLGVYVGPRSQLGRETAMAGRWPTPRQILDWQNSDETPRKVMGDLGDRIMSGKIPAGQNLPDVTEIKAEWPEITESQIYEIMTQLAEAGMAYRHDGQLWWRANDRPRPRRQAM